MKKLLAFILLLSTISCYGYDQQKYNANLVAFEEKFGKPGQPKKRRPQDKILKFILQDNNEYAVETCFLRSLFSTNEVAVVYRKKSSTLSAKAFIHPQASQEFVNMVQTYLSSSDQNCNYRVIKTEQLVRSLLQ
jgi:hypothetical protein